MESISPYLTYKWLHVVGAILFVGNIVVTGIWKTLADRTKDPKVIAYAQRMVSLTDWIFTGGGAVLLLLSGILMALENTAVMRQIWFGLGFALFIASGAIWIAALIPIQKKQAKLAKEFGSGGEIPADYWKLSRTWGLLGMAATLLPLVTVFIMVFKPN